MLSQSPCELTRIYFSMSSHVRFSSLSSHASGNAVEFFSLVGKEINSCRSDLDEVTLRTYLRRELKHATAHVVRVDPATY
jgi:hypothetical protein